MTQLHVRGTPIERFWGHVEKTPTCWLWTAYVNRNGYGVFIPDTKHLRSVSAYRWFWEQTHGPVPEGLELDHLCRVRRCVNPAHLEAVTHRENMWRGSNAAKTHCKRGHTFDVFRPGRLGRPYRVCRACKRLRSGWKGLAPSAERTHCPHGHEYTESNTYLSKSGRECRECWAVRRWARRAAKATILVVQS